MKQKDAFLESEGDVWFTRNVRTLSNRKFPDSYSLLGEILGLPSSQRRGLKILEIGCGDGGRLNWLKENLGFECYGVDPSIQAVRVAESYGIHAQIGTADKLPFNNSMFDIVIFGFCLYLCDREDLFRIAAEADRVLKSPGWLLIKDFYSPTPLKREYHHRAGLFSYKMDYSTLFTWNPSYMCLSHRVTHHEKPNNYTDDSNEWVATTVLRKNLERHG
mgnify:CR=1 FL=1